MAMTWKVMLFASVFAKVMLAEASPAILVVGDAGEDVSGASDAESDIG